ncbi:hypothetical protein [Ponticaulis profundi]|uniref:Uncharacterized protein n=1 Tax=Ponticaulis profundi TaxID=2665222 RepID=A0ABW1SEE2_9PROT
MTPTARYGNWTGILWTAPFGLKDDNFRKEVAIYERDPSTGRDSVLKGAFEIVQAGRPKRHPADKTDTEYCINLYKGVYK